MEQASHTPTSVQMQVAAAAFRVTDTPVRVGQKKCDVHKTTWLKNHCNDDSLKLTASV